ncbi:dimethylsulfonioproprionate lyase family protein [Pseudomonas sp. PDM26]|uniref:dimethylsulfonioproprionate lyase family protein n=1 Tax=Pseudomonas sp. PDM26 TaxID=2854766 RepID=UPI00210A5051|nr:dimethylsulfonioproprionate lyase family protein [Pseudomonas sp. PDM26]
MQSNCNMSEQELLMHGVIMREALLRILARHSPLCGIDGGDTEACVRSLADAHLNVGLPPFKGNPLPSSLYSTASQALSDAPRIERDFKTLLTALEPLLHNSRWIKRFATEGDDAGFEEKHRHALILGEGALFECSTMTVGLAVMAPNLCYPFHTHPPAEFYVVLSEGDWYREDVGWWNPGPGGVVFNPPSAVHSMRSTHKPLLALWGLINESSQPIRERKTSADSVFPGGRSERS